MLLTGDTGNAQSAWITSNAIFSHFIFDEKPKIVVDSIQRLLDISLGFFIQVKIHNIYFKLVPGFVDIRFTSQPKLMKKIKHTTKTHLFIKSVDFEFWSCIEKRWDLFIDTYILSISQS